MPRRGGEVDFCQALSPMTAPTSNAINRETNRGRVAKPVMTGRRPKPTELRRLEGNPGRRPLNEDEPQIDSELPPCPEHLPDRAKAVWHELGAELAACGVLTRLDATAFELLCSSYALYLESAEAVAKFGAVWIERGDGKIPKFAYSPHWAVMNRAWKQVQSMLAEFGMTPSSRSRVVAVKSRAQSQLEEYINSK
jgi:P27 family predicted phage terminase small subunit